MVRRKGVTLINVPYVESGMSRLNPRKGSIGDRMKEIVKAVSRIATALEHIAESLESLTKDAHKLARKGDWKGKTGPG